MRDKPAAYRIQIQGHLGQHWADYLGGLSISVSGEPDRAVTTLSGHALDQAALFGILNSPYDMGYPLPKNRYGGGPGTGITLPPYYLPTPSMRSPEKLTAEFETCLS